LETLRSSGSAVEVVEPNQEFLEISGWGTSLMDSSRAVKAYEAGVRQGVEESQRIAGLWNR
jgi:NTE family protein